jgi:regulator of cell morphogenesis and NO signaling
MTQSTNEEHTMDAMNPDEASVIRHQVDAVLANWLIRDLVDAYPETLSVLGPLGLDLCCGGGHPIGEALDLHGLDREAIMPRIASVVEASQSRDR